MSISAIQQELDAPTPLEKRSGPWMLYTDRQRYGFLAILFLVGTSKSVDAFLISVVLEPVKHEFAVSDTMLGFLSGLCFALPYAAFGLPWARWADRGNRCTVITLSLTLWSAMTMFCGLAQTFWQLAIARAGIGAAEAGGVSSGQSLIADYFPPERRATALAIFLMHATVGYVLGLGVGGYVVETHGWRSAFLLMGAPGIALALVARLTLREPRVHLDARTAGSEAESMNEALLRLWQKRSFRWALVGLALYTFVATGGLLFVPTFLVRVTDSSIAVVGVTYGLVAAIACLIGAPAGGWLADRLSQRDIRWLAWFPAVAYSLAGAIYLVAFTVSDVWTFMAIIFPAHLLLEGGWAPLFAGTHAVCGTRRRTTAIAILLLLATLVGSGTGALATGALSDGLSSVYGSDGLRYSLMTMMILLVASGGIFYLFGREMPSDIEE